MEFTVACKVDDLFDDWNDFIFQQTFSFFCNYEKMFQKSQPYWALLKKNTEKWNTSEKNVPLYGGIKHSTSAFYYRGRYQCTAHNGVGPNHSKMIVLNVKFGPTITVPIPRVHQVINYLNYKKVPLS